MTKKKNRILVAVDGSEQSLNAVRYVGRMLVPEQTAIKLFHVASRYPEPLLDQGGELRTPSYADSIRAWESLRRATMEMSS